MEAYYVLDERGKPILEPDLEAWSTWIERADRGVARTPVTPNVLVLTTFTGFDESVEPETNAPMLFETRVFGGALDGEVTQYPTRAESLSGHAQLVDWCRLSESPGGGIMEEPIIS